MSGFRCSRRHWLQVAALVAGASARALNAATTTAADPAASRIRVFYDALLETMKQAKALGIRGRFDKLAPAIRATFDFPAMTRIAVGPKWEALNAEQQTRLIDRFTRMTIAIYANRFDGYAGERFEVTPSAEPRGADRIVRSRLVPVDGEPVVLNYLMRGAGESWKAVDVYVDGTISELAIRRSEFGSILGSGGPEALIERLRERGDKLLEGA